MANFISIFRIFVALFAIALLYVRTTWAYMLALILTVIVVELPFSDLAVNLRLKPFAG